MGAKAAGLGFAALTVSSFRLPYANGGTFWESHDRAYAMNLLGLPKELLDLFTSKADKASLQALRLTSRTLQPAATKSLFHHLTVQRSEKSSQKVLKILSDERLNPLVRTITFVTRRDLSGTSDSGDGLDLYSDGDDEPDSPLPESYEIAMQQIGKFHNLERVELTFHPGCVGESNLDDFSIRPPLQGLFWRNTVLTLLVQSLNDEEHPATRVHVLSITDLQDQMLDSLVYLDDFTAALSRLDGLELQVATETMSATPDKEIEQVEAHDFFQDELKGSWLRPLDRQLKHLKLYADMYWGYFPYCDLRDLGFPDLRSLHLGNMTFAHDWQLEWILSISTLEDLVLDDCPILVGCHMYHEFGPERSPPTLEQYQSYGGDSAWYYHARWHEYFHRIRRGLPRLMHFACGHGPWLENRAFEESANLHAHISPLRYVCFEAGTGPSPWLQADHVESWQVVWEDAPPYPTCESEDRAALTELLQTISARVRNDGQ